jgi:hypothetical protein
MSDHIEMITCGQLCSFMITLQLSDTAERAKRRNADCHKDQINAALTSTA